MTRDCANGVESRKKIVVAGWESMQECKAVAEVSSDIFSNNCEKASDLISVSIFYLYFQFNHSKQDTQVCQVKTGGVWQSN